MYRLRAWRREKKYYDDGRCLGVTQSRIDLNPGTVVALRYRGVLASIIRRIDRVRSRRETDERERERERERNEESD